jgi:hypothetical protein
MARVKKSEAAELTEAAEATEAKPERYFKIAMGIMTVKGAVKSPGNIVAEHQLNTDADTLVKAGLIVEVEAPK